MLAVQEDQLKEWSQEYYRTDLEKEAIYLTAEHSAALLRQIQSRKRQAPKRLYSRWAFSAAAAVIALLLGAQLFRHLAESRPSATPAIAMAQPVKKYRQVSNMGAAKRLYWLPDSSAITLQPGSAIAYDEPFDSTKRDVQLQQGKAMFTVAKEAGRPFTVYAGTVATTALGTSFTVEALSHGMVTIQLYEGKVVVRSKGLLKDVYLLPGQQVMVNQADAYCKVSAFDTADIAGSSKKQQVTTGTAPFTGNGLVFRKTPLTEVFSQLHQKYGVTIVSEPAEMKGLVFTGAFSEKDNLQAILSVISSLNSLSLRQQEDSIFINKEK